jgi:hypothetical protein
MGSLIQCKSAEEGYRKLSTEFGKLDNPSNKKQ